MNRHVCLVFRHSCIVLQHSCLVFHACLFNVSALLFNTVPYLQVSIVLRPSHSLLLVYADKHLYDKCLNNKQYENKVSQL